MYVNILLFYNHAVEMPENVQESGGGGNNDYDDIIKAQVQNGKLEEIQNNFMHMNSAATTNPAENESSTDVIYEIVAERNNNGVDTQGIISQEIYKNVSFDEEALYEYVVANEEQDSVEGTTPVQDDLKGTTPITDDLEGNTSIQDDLEGTIPIKVELEGGTISIQDDLEGTISIQDGLADTLPMQDDLAEIEIDV